ncbi:replication-associated recombination protein A [Guyparkeria hydrothermalis]|uniref:replication-associated recombination protein A n=1 Tax=Guyparkeria hydrothermalis TaxID=923 RepID=UPI0020209C3F|nr:replication-associated recombination protein A [Guyparkeria hydrothermalis]MCL7743935.1 replication-associated recombination protein A [Guyparkeria hydrothermalis]
MAAGTPPQDDLFGSEEPPPEPAQPREPADAYRPLADRLRPHDLTDFAGQVRVVGDEAPLRVAMEKGQAHSCLLWGPPGVGKTTLARLYAERLQAEIVHLSAVEAGVRELRGVIEAARARRQATGRLTVLFLDEIHRFNKSQQDQLLPSVERGVLVLVGATTENPSFSLNNALLSRLRVYRLEPLGDGALKSLLERALEHPEGVRETTGGPSLTMEPVIADRLVAAADGDARRLLTLLELAAQLAHETDAGDAREVDEGTLEALMSQSPRRFDQGGDEFYDQISAMHKAIRGSNPDAGAYWLLRMLDGGADPAYLARRLVRIASEDIGNADPRALNVALDAWTAYDRLGIPEGELMLTQAAMYLAVAPKSNAVYNAHNAILATVKQRGTDPVPMHLRNAPTSLMEREGWGKGYRYAHDEPDAYAAGETYLPDGLTGERFYRPVDRGLERTIAERITHWRQLDEQAGNRRSPVGDDSD